MDWKTTAFLFPGQGSQSVGMGKSLADAYPVARQTFEQADDILQTKFSDLIFNGPEDELNDTYNTQASMFVVGVAALRTLQHKLPEAVPGFAAGHSLGEFTALVCAEALTFEDGLRLVRERGRLMKEAGETNPGGMGALLGLVLEQAEDVCRQAAEQTGEEIVIANDNCPGQVVISGGAGAVDAALELGKAAGAKRAIKLALSVAAHSPLMQSAANAFESALGDVTFQAPKLPVYGNVSTEPLPTEAEIIAELKQQIVAPVRWTESVHEMIRDGAETFVEIGNGEILSGLVKRIDRKRKRIVVQDVETLERFLEESLNISG